jgi:hypothetical protein
VIAASASPPKASAPDTWPGRSKCRPSGSEDSGTASQASANARDAIGTTSRKTLRQPNCSISKPPMLGPMAKASPLQLAQIPSVRPRAAGSGHTTRMIASEEGSSSAAPMPVIARAAISTPIAGAKAQTSEPAAMTAAPIANARRLP